MSDGRSVDNSRPRRSQTPPLVDTDHDGGNVVFGVGLCPRLETRSLVTQRSRTNGKRIPAGQLSSIQVKADESTRVRPFEPKEYKRILAAVGKCGLQPRNAARVKACIQLQRWSGLSIVDAVCLSKDELVQDGKVFRVRVQRRKTGTHVNNVIPEWLGVELLKVKNGNPHFVFVSGEATPKGCCQHVRQNVPASIHRGGR